MEFGKKIALRGFLRRCEGALLDHVQGTQIKYPADCVGVRKWRDSDLIEKNECFLDDADKNANVYAIYTARKTGAYSLRYIGQTKSKGARTRLSNHLFKKHEETGAKLREIMAHVRAGGRVRVSWISIEPESLRHYVEEELIKKHPEADWNKQSR